MAVESSKLRDVYLALPASMTAAYLQVSAKCQNDYVKGPPKRFEFNRYGCYVSVNNALALCKARRLSVVPPRRADLKFGYPNIMPVADNRSMDEDDLRRRVSFILCNTILFAQIFNACKVM